MIRCFSQSTQLMQKQAEKRLRDAKETRELRQAVADGHKNSKLAMTRLQEQKQDIGESVHSAPAPDKHLSTPVLHTLPLTTFWFLLSTLRSERSLAAEPGAPPSGDGGGAGGARQALPPHPGDPSN